MRSGKTKYLREQIPSGRLVAEIRIGVDGQHVITVMKCPHCSCFTVEPRVVFDADSDPVAAFCEACQVYVPVA